MTLAADLHNDAAGVDHKVLQFTVATDPDDYEVVAAVAGKKIKVISYTLISACTIEWRSGTTPISGMMPTNVTVPLVVAENRAGHFETAAGEALNIRATGATAVTISGHITYVVKD